MVSANEPEARQRAAALGKLTRWILSKEWADACGPDFKGDRTPITVEDLDVSRGCCWVVCVNGSPDEFPWVRPVFVIPLQWEPGTAADRGTPAHSRRLPRPFHEIADQVRNALNMRDWALHPHPEVSESPLLPHLDQFIIPSVWAPLAAGLYLAQHGATSRREVWASAAWHGEGARVVGDLPKKIAYAASCGATIFYAEAGQAEHYSRLPPEKQVSGIEVRGLATGRRASEVLQDYLQALDAPPLPDGPFNERCGYYDRILDRGRAAEFYRTHLLNDLVTRIKPQFELANPLTHLVTIVSDNPEVILLNARASGVTRCLLLYDGTEKYRDLAERACAELKGFGVSCQMGQFQNNCMADAMEKEIRSFVGQENPDGLLFDLTPGSKLMLLNLQVVVQDIYPVAWCMYLYHEYGHRKARPGTEQVKLWQPSLAPREVRRAVEIRPAATNP